MSQKQDKKIRQYYRRDFHDQVNAFKRIVRMRSRFIPKWLYFLLAKIFFTQEFLSAYKKEIRVIEEKERQFKKGLKAIQHTTQLK